MENKCNCKRLSTSRDSNNRFMGILNCNKCGKKWTYSKIFGWVKVETQSKAIQNKPAKTSNNQKVYKGD